MVEGEEEAAVVDRPVVGLAAPREVEAAALAHAVAAQVLAAVGPALRECLPSHMWFSVAMNQRELGSGDGANLLVYSRAGQPGFAGAGSPRAFGGGRYYGGGGARPFKSGSRTPIAGIAGILFIGAALAFWPGMWLYGANMYHYNDRYRFHNATTDEEEELPVICACDPYNPCGCEENNSTEYVQALIGDGSYRDLNQSLVTVAEVNGTKTLLVNGTLMNGTEPPVPEDDEGAGAGLRAMVEALGYWPMVAAVISAVFAA